MNEQNNTTGKVILAGAGPGDPELITAKAIRWLRKAEVILADRLVSEEILDLYASEKAEIIFVGKQCRKGASTPQAVINQLMLQYAKMGKLVVRLKGGDVSIFSNILDELEILKAHNIPYEIVPGVSAALGAAAYAGIPLTARDHATAVRFLTYYKASVISADYWKELAATNDTLVFYMSADTAGEVVQHLLQNGVATDVHIAVVEQATTPYQRVHSCAIHQFEKELSHLRFASPSLLIIGRVAALHQQYGWVANSGLTGHYFAPVTAPLLSLSPVNADAHATTA